MVAFCCREAWNAARAQDLNQHIVIRALVRACGFPW